MNRPPAKLGLDIFRQTCYTILRKCGHRTSASISAFQAEEVGSIPIARSIKKRRQFVKNRRLFFCFGYTFGSGFDFSAFPADSKTAGSSRKKELPAVVFHSVRPRAANSLARPSSYTVGAMRSHSCFSRSEPLPMHTLIPAAWVICRSLSLSPKPMVSSSG